MRGLVLGVIAVAALARTVRADGSQFHPFAGVAPSLGFVEAQSPLEQEGLSTELGIARGRLALVGEGDVFYLHSQCGALVCVPGTGDGSEFRAGAAVRWTFAKDFVFPGVDYDGKDGSIHHDDAWLELVGGEERLAVAGVKTVARPDVGIGAGLALANNGHRNSTALWLRVTVAPATGAAIPEAAVMDEMPSRGGVGWAGTIGWLVAFGG
jgi:hypothetical protein